MTDAELSIMHYRNGRNFSNYQDASFTPVFLSDFNATEIAEAEAVCNSSTAQPCLFDYLATNNTAIALLTKEVDDENLVITDDLGKSYENM